MRKYLIILGLIAIATAAYAQVTANQTVLGSVGSSGCTGSNTVCFKQYSNANPMPITIVSR